MNHRQAASTPVRHHCRNAPTSRRAAGRHIATRPAATLSSMKLKTVTAVAAVGLLVAIAAQAAVGETDRQYCERQEGIARDACLRELDRAAREPARAKPPSAAGSSPSAAPVARTGGGGAPPYQVSGGFHVD